ncbi:DUF305 domain-containing protein [Leeuwenhoekiella sp. W20_SRS_FM14]|uniref:DUF305 domain-containing protein n=1 Tax=Leeuwenhoekiella sp. W20_SRS_FM14 TaxID=3240270 RepID=UPI003F9EAD5C
MINTDNNNSHSHKGNYTKFLMMLGCSFIAMYITMYLNTYKIDHVYFSLTRFYMSCLGICTMAVIMLLFMLKMYKSKTKNAAILLGSVLVFCSALYLVRAQKPVNDVTWMRAMIPHHSIAILTSKRAAIKDPEVKKLAEDIIRAQEKEIGEMKAMIKRLEAAE